MANLWQPSLQPILDDNGDPVSAGKWFFYLTGTTTLAPIFSDETGETELTNPVVADDAGRVPPIYLNSEAVYRVRVTDANNSIIGSDVDPVRGFDEGVAGAVLVAAQAARDDAEGFSISAAGDAAQTASDGIIVISQRQAAESARDAAELARDATVVDTNVYETEALGRAAVADSESFLVQSSGSSFADLYRRTDANTSVLIATYASKADVDSAISQLEVFETEGLTPLKEWRRVEYTLNINDGFYRSSNGSFVSSASYGNIIYNITGDRPLRATATLGGSAMALAVYFSDVDGGGDFLGFQSAGDNSTHTNEILNIPDNAQSVIICGLDNDLIELQAEYFIDALTVSAALRSETRLEFEQRQDLQFQGDIAEIYGHTVQGDSYARYILGGGVYPTVNGWGVDMSSNPSPVALGLDRVFDEDDTLQRMQGLETARVKDRFSFSEEVLEINGSGLTILNYQAGSQNVFVNTDSGDTREIECAHIPNNKNITVSHRTENHNGRVILDAGQNQQWSDFGERFLVVPAGVRLDFYRLSTTNFIVNGVTSLNNNTLSAISEAEYTSIRRDASILVAGQSLGDQGYFRGASHGAFNLRASEIGGDMPAYFHVIDAAFGGSGICERDADGSDNYWVDMTDPSNPTDGPNLILALQQIASNLADVSQPNISSIFWKHGQQSSAFVDSPESPNANFTAQMFLDATNYVFARLRAALNANTPILIEPLGRRTAVLASNTGRMQIIRELLQDITNADAFAFFGAETWDLVLRDSVHPDDWSYQIIGARDADMLAKHVYNVAGIIDHLVVQSAVFNSERNSIDVVIRANEDATRIYSIADPIGFKVFDAEGTDVSIVRAHWVAVDSSPTDHYTETLRLFLNGSATGGILYHLWDFVSDYDIDKAIRSRAQNGSKSLRAVRLDL
jgi:hypothetical protein